MEEKETLTAIYVLDDMKAFSRGLLKLPASLKHLCGLIPLGDIPFERRSGGWVLADQIGLMQMGGVQETAERVFLLNERILAMSIYANYHQTRFVPVDNRFSYAIKYSRHGFAGLGNIELKVVGPDDFWGSLFYMKSALVEDLGLKSSGHHFRAVVPPARSKACSLS